MFNFNKKKIGRPTKSNQGERASYKMMAITPAAHAKIREIADKKNTTMIDTIDRLAGVR